MTAGRGTTREPEVEAPGSSPAPEATGGEDRAGARRSKDETLQRGSVLLLKNVLFTVLVPGTVALLIPYRLLASAGQLHPGDAGPLRYLGLAPIALGVAVYLSCVWGFALRGEGTPAPIDPPKKLVVGGPYRLTRNPMYVAVLCVILGESILFLSGRLLAYGLLVLAAFHSAVVLYEEPTLRRRFGSSYESYCRSAPRWLIAWKAR